MSTNDFDRTPEGQRMTRWSILRGTKTKRLGGPVALLLIVCGSGIAAENTGIGPQPVNLYMAGTFAF